MRAGKSYIKHFGDARVAAMRSSGRFTPTADFSKLAGVDAILVCVPTPLGPSREPDLSYVASTSETIAKHMARGTLVVLESTTYPGTTVEVMQPILETSGLKAGTDFHLAFSPEREDPGSGIETRTIPKIVGGIDAASTALTTALYALAFADVRPVRDTQTAEAVKITENIFRAVNIALVNELKVDLFAHGHQCLGRDRRGQDQALRLYGRSIPAPAWAGIASRSTRSTCPGGRGASAPIRTSSNWPAKSIVPCRITWCRNWPTALSDKFRRAINGAKILVVGVAYKKNVDDLRESPALEIMELLMARGAEVSYYDPYCPEIPQTREHGALKGMTSTDCTPATLAGFDAALIVTDHDSIDFAALVKASRLVVDTRNATRSVTEHREKIVQA